MASMIDVPERFAADTVAREGAAGRAWLAELPTLVDTLYERWGLVPDPVAGAPMHGYLSLVIPVLRGAEPCVLRVSWLRETTATEALALTVWRGRGAVRLLDSDPGAGALLLERLDGRRSLSDVEVDVAVPAAGSLLRHLAVPAGEAADRLPHLDVWARRLAAELPGRRHAAGDPFGRRLLDEAVDLAAGLASDAGSLLISQDLHYENVLAAGEAAGDGPPWRLIDPKPVVGEPEAAVAPLLWRRFEEMAGPEGLRRRVATLVETAALDPERTRAWSLLHTIDYWLWALSAGLTEDPVRCALLTDWLSGTGC